MDVRNEIIRAISKASNVPEKEINLDFPENELFGDYSTNLALIEARKLDKNPRTLASELVKTLSKEDNLKNVIEKIEIAGPGFLNFWLKSDVLLDNLITIDRQKENFGKSSSLKGKKIMFEYGDANTHKLPHIGHLFSYTYGEAVTRILNFAGASVRKVCYQGDIGLHVAKCLWAFKKENPPVPASIEDKAMLLQNMYQEGSQAYDESEEIKKEINNLNKSIYDQDPKIFDLYKKTRQWSVLYYKNFEEQLDVSYQRYYYESEVYKEGQKIVEENVGKIFEKGEGGALIFKGSNFGLHDRVFVTSYGTPTYEAKDMYLQELKDKEWPMDLCIITTAYEQNAYFDVVFKALENLDKKWVGRLMHIGFGMINLKSGKMSSRTGEIIGAIDLIKKVQDEVGKLNKDPEITQAVSVGAIKYSFLKNNYLQNITFDIKESISKEGNSGPYLQYTVARCNSVLEKAPNFKSQTIETEKNDKLEKEEELILRYLTRFEEVVKVSAKSYSPNILCNYVYNLAQKFNTFYNKDKIIGSDKEDFRLFLTSGVYQVLRNGLNLLGIQTPEKM